MGTRIVPPESRFFAGEKFKFSEEQIKEKIGAEISGNTVINTSDFEDDINVTATPDKIFTFW